MDQLHIKVSVTNVGGSDVKYGTQAETLIGVHVVFFPVASLPI